MFLAKAFRSDPRPRQEAKVLTDNGYRVIALSWDRDAKFPFSDNVESTRVNSYRPVNLANFSKFGLLLGGVLFQGILFFETIKIIRNMKLRPVIHAHDVNTLFSATILKKLRLASRLVYDCHELTYAVYTEWFNELIGALVRTIEENLLQFADAIITVSDPIGRYLRQFSPATVLYNCPSLASIPRITKQRARKRMSLPLDSFIVAFIGELREDCRLDLLLEVARQVRDPKFCFLVVGDGPQAPAFRRAASQMRCPNLMIRSRVPRDRALEYLSASDLTWVLYSNPKESLNGRVGLPWKFSESLACGVPILVESGTLRASLVTKYKCGVVLEDDRPSKIAEILTRLANNHAKLNEMSLAAKQVARSTFNWEMMSRRLIRTYSQLWGTIQS